MIDEAVTFRPASPIWEQIICRCWQWWLRCTHTRKQKRQLVVSESVSLGEKRALVVAQFEQERFLIGVTGASMVLLSKLPDMNSTD
jgi:flagellar biogenesis protein FliO